MIRPLAISAFSGIGALELGAESSGFKIGLAIENDPIIASMHLYNFPNTIMLCEDAMRIDCDRIVSKLMQAGIRQQINLLLYSSPCQSFSSLGLRKDTDPRSDLVFGLVRYLQEIRPQYFLFENVPGLTQGKVCQAIYQPLLKQIEDCNYEYICLIIDASNHQVAQRRKRLFILGWHQGEKLISWENLQSIKTNPDVTVKDAIADLGEIFPYVKTDLGTETAILNYNGYRENFSYPPTGIFANCDLRNFDKITYGHIVPKHTDKVKQRFAGVKPGLKDEISRAVRLNQNSICPTLTAGTGTNAGRFSALKPIHYSQDRAISVREFARLTGLPDWFQLSFSKLHACRGLGNAVCPQVAKFLCDRILEALGVSQSEVINDIQQLDPVNEQLLRFKPLEARAYFDDFYGRET